MSDDLITAAEQDTAQMATPHLYPGCHRHRCGMLNQISERTKVPAHALFVAGPVCGRPYSRSHHLHLNYEVVLTLAIVIGAGLLYMLEARPLAGSEVAMKQK